MAGSTDSGRTPVRFAPHRGQSEQVFRVNAREIERAARRQPLAGFPDMRPLPSKEAARDYLAQTHLVCLLCGRSFAVLGKHLRDIHDTSVLAYQDYYRLPRSKGLAGSIARQRMRDITKARGTYPINPGPSHQNPGGGYAQMVRAERGEEYTGSPLEAYNKAMVPTRPPRAKCSRCGKLTRRADLGVAITCWPCRYPADRPPPPKRLSGWQRGRNKPKPVPPSVEVER